MSSRRRGGVSPFVVPGLVVLVLVVLVAVWLLRDRLPPIIETAPAPKPGPASSPAAAKSDLYEVYFTTPVYPDKPENHHGGIDEKFVAYVDAATKTLDIAVYEFDLENVARAIAQAKARGVAVRMVTDSDTVNATRDDATQKALKIIRDAGITIVPDERGAIMHHKFTVRDGETVWTGSWNYTVGDSYRLNNNAQWLRSSELARLYTAEFERMFTERKFGPSKGKAPPPPPIQVGPLQVQVVFAPGNGVARVISERIVQARTEIRFLAFSFTSDPIGKAMMDRAAAGVSVQGVFEKTGSETRFSEYGKMRSARLDVYQDGNPYPLHHKVILLDRKTTATGSFNFSDSADQDNDENCLIVDDPDFASAYLAEYERMLALARQPAGVRATPEKELPR